MKKYILLASASLVVLATIIAVFNLTLVDNPITLTRVTTSAFALGLGSIGLFFVGLVFPQV